MPAVIIIDNSYSNEDAVDRLVYYILNPKKIRDYYICGYAVNLMNIESVITSIKLIKNIYGKMDQRQVRHIIVSFANYEGVTCDDVDWIQSAAVDFYRQLGYQAISAIHVPIDKDDKIHFHMAVNTVNLYDGSKYSGTYTQSQELFNYLKGLREGGLNWEIKHKYVESLEEELSLI